MVEGGGHPGFRQQGGGLLGGAALLGLQGVRALLVETERVDAVDDELASQFLGEGLQGLAVPVPRHRHDDDIAAPRALRVVRALDTGHAEPAAAGFGTLGAREPMITFCPARASR